MIFLLNSLMLGCKLKYCPQLLCSIIYLYVCLFICINKFNISKSVFSCKNVEFSTHHPSISLLYSISPIALQPPGVKIFFFFLNFFFLKKNIQLLVYMQYVRICPKSRIFDKRRLLMNSCYPYTLHS